MADNEWIIYSIYLITTDKVIVQQAMLMMKKGNEQKHRQKLKVVLKLLI